MKKCVIKDGKVINIGDWDYQYVTVVTQPAEIDEEGNVIKEAVIEQQVTNPFPDGATIEERDFSFDLDRGWFETNTAQEPSLEERLKAAEDTINYLLGL